jgi:ATP-dependent Lon protease
MGPFGGNKAPKKTEIEEYPILPLRDLVIFPQTIMSVYITYKAGIAALEEALKRDYKVFAVCQKSAEALSKEQKFADMPSAVIWDAGTVVRIIQNLRLPDNTFRVVLQGEYRGLLVPSQSRPFGSRKDSNLARVAPIKSENLEKSATVGGNADGINAADKEQSARETIAIMRAVQKSFTQYAEFSKKIGAETLTAMEKTENPEKLVNIIANAAAIKTEKKVELLRIAEPRERLEKLLESLEMENEIFGIQKNISGKVKTRMDKNQREYILHEQLKEINKELGKDAAEDEFAELERNIKERRPGEEVLSKAEKEISRLRKLQPFSPEAGVLRTYLEWIKDLPWSEYSVDSEDLGEAEKILNEDHYEMRKAKERIIEFIAVRALNTGNFVSSGNEVPDGNLADKSAAEEFTAELTGEEVKPDGAHRIKGPILCFVGPPGTGKTSLGKSVARALGRKFVRISLGGVRDEAEIRGHRKTYVGALPGKIVQSMRKAGTMNPVFLLDEIDKLSHDFRGDPASALLEVLDPEQNSTFTDHYMEVPYDLSRVLFIATANSLYNIPYALLDRMEIIEIPGYGENEKLAIAQKFLVPKELAENGLSQAKIAFRDEAIREIIRHWTMESGVRGLEREIARCVRRVAKEAVNRDYGKSQEKPIEKFKKTIRQEDLEKLLGRRKYKNDVVYKEARTGVSYGLAWTETGGTMLPVETIRFDGHGDCLITGNLGDVMKESARIALSYLRSVQDNYSFQVKDMGKTDFHIHVPEGAIPKDGPSAGVALAASLLSTLCRTPPKPGFAMTGELTLTGRVLPIGGLKEKLLAAVRNGMESVLLPADNKEDWEELSEDIKKALTIHFVENAEEAFLILFDKGILKSTNSRKTPHGSADAQGKEKKPRSPRRKTGEEEERIASRRRRGAKGK